MLDVLVMVSGVLLIEVLRKGRSGCEYGFVV